MKMDSYLLPDDFYYKLIDGFKRYYRYKDDREIASVLIRSELLPKIGEFEKGHKSDNDRGINFIEDVLTLLEDSEDDEFYIRYREYLDEIKADANGDVDLIKMGISNKTEWKKWLLKNHPDKNPQIDQEIVKKVISKGKALFDKR